MRNWLPDIFQESSRQEPTLFVLTIYQLQCFKFYGKFDEFIENG